MADDFATITNMNEFQAELVRVMKNVELGMAQNVLGKVAMDTHRNLQKRTPRKTGRARAGWNTTVDQLPSEWKPPGGLNHYALTPFNGRNAIQYDSLINLSNNVEYIVPLDEGHSVQAPDIVNYVLALVTQNMRTVTGKESKRKIK